MASPRARHQRSRRGHVVVGKPVGLAELVRNWRQRVERCVRRILASPDSEVAQEVRLAVFKGLPKLRKPEQFAL